MNLFRTRLFAVFVIFLGGTACLLSVVSRDPFIVQIGKLSISAGLLFLFLGFTILLWGRPLSAKEIGNLIHELRMGIREGISQSSVEVPGNSTNTRIVKYVRSARTEARRRTLVMVVLSSIIAIVGVYIVLEYSERNTVLLIAKHGLKPIESEIASLIDHNMLDDQLRDRYLNTRNNIRTLESNFNILDQRPAFKEIVTILDSVFSRTRLEPDGLCAGAGVFWKKDSANPAGSSMSYAGDSMLSRLYVLKGKIIQQLSKNVYVDSLPRALAYYLEAQSLDAKYDAALIGWTTIQLELVKRSHDQIDTEYLQTVNTILEHYDRLFRETGTDYQRAQLLNNSSDLLLDLMNKYLDGKITKDFMTSEPLLKLYNRAARQPALTLAQIRECLDSAIVLAPNKFPIHLTRAQFFSTYARCMKYHQLLKTIPHTQLSEDVFAGHKEISFKKSLYNAIDCLRTAEIFGTAHLGFLDTTTNSQGRSNLTDKYMGILMESPELLKIALELRVKPQSWLTCPQYGSFAVH